MQSMTTTKTADVDGTLAQIYALAAAGCDIVRCTCNEEEAAEGLAQIVPRSPVPIVADIHFQHKLALAAMEAGVQALRLNPGNIRKAEHIKLVAAEAKDRGISDPHRRERRLARSRDGRAARRHHARGARRVGDARARPVPRGRLRRREDLGEGVERAADDRRVPLAVGDDRSSVASRRHRSRTVAAGLDQGRRRHRHAARRRHRRHDPLLAHRRSRSKKRRPGARCSRRSGCASARASISSRARRAGAPRST